MPIIVLKSAESPAGRELLFLVDGLGADVIEKYASVIPTIASLTATASLRKHLFRRQLRPALQL
jgi:hypothetical protein